MNNNKEIPYLPYEKFKRESGSQSLNIEFNIDHDETTEKSLESNRLVKLVEMALDMKLSELTETQLEQLSKIINFNIDNSKKMYLIGKVFEGEEWKTICSDIEGTAIVIKNE